MQDIRTTVTESLTSAGYGSYTSYAAPVIAALEARQQEQADLLTQFAVQQGMSEAQAKAALQGVGLVDPDPEPEATVTAEGGEDRIGRLEALVERLVGAAHSAGLRF